MKCYTVAIMTPKGEYKSVYLGGDLAEAKRIYREYKREKFGEDCIAAFFFQKPQSRRVSGTARHLKAVEKSESNINKSNANSKEVELDKANKKPAKPRGK